ncbi:MAG: phytanoyl-CoA dioxygenase family protein, partial [Pseudomonadota bacterium]
MSDLSADLSGSFAPMTVANDLLKDPPALRRQLDEEGYLFFRGLLPADTILGLRAEITAILARHGAILGGASEAEAIAKAMPFREGEERYFAVYDEIIRLERLYALSHHPALTRMMESALGGSAFPHPLSIVRLIFPDNAEVTTPPHQDYPNNQGSERLTATWIPLGDCPSKMGGLAVLRGSHKFGVMPVSAHLGAGNRQA